MSLIHNTLFIRAISNQNVKMNDAQIINKISYDRLEHILDRDDCPRKRRRLTHLSADEKLLRRKLKNRVAAQTARDRKKALMTDFEVRIMQLEEDNKSLVEENAELRLHSGILEEENNDLKQRLGLPAVDEGRVKAEMECKVSAVPTVPQQKERIPGPARTTPLYTAWLLMMMSLTIFSVFSAKSTHPEKRRKLNQLCITSPTHPCKLGPDIRWWGPQQQSWTPSMKL